ncbi:MAG: short-chain dehydrogenase [Gracilibacter sp. BRH_c7a]|nr:MAG: short-chain dehydrogenase [Gracilibacter sp. BRH_c7a]
MKRKKHTALVLASSSGLGFAAAEALCRDGHNIIICSRSPKLYQAEKTLKNNYSGVGILAIPSDVTCINNLNDMVREGRRKFGVIDILFTNGPGPKPGSFEDLRLDDFVQAHHDLLLPVVYTAQQLIPDMVSQKWGRIIMNTSITAKEPAVSLLLSNVYRAGLAAFAKTLALQLAPDHITVNALGPAAFRTERALQLIQNAAEKQGRSPGEIERENTARLPMKHYNEPAEFGSIVAFLAGEAAGALTGSFIAVDGGTAHSVF